MVAPLPANEQERMTALLHYQLLDTESEAELDEVTALASQICGTPISLITLVEQNRQWFKSNIGLHGVTQTSRDVAFCAHAIHQMEIFEVPDASADQRFKNNPLVTGEPNIGFYAGMPLTTPDGYNLGTLCVIDHHPRRLTEDQRKALYTLSKHIMARFELRLQVKQLEETKKELQVSEEELRQQGEELQATNSYLEQNISELHRTQAQLVQAEKMASLGMLTAGIAHEINNPINFVYAGVDNLSVSIKEMFSILHAYQAVESETEPARKLVALEAISQLKQDLYYRQNIELIARTIAAIKAGVDRTVEIIKGLRNFSRLDEAELKTAHVHEGIDNTLMLLSHYVKEGIVIEKTYDASVPAIECYPGQLNQVFMNLITNAIQAMEGKGKISINTRNEQEVIVISISDTGKGIPAGLESRIFEPFFTTKEVGKGTGLGLSISYGIVGKHKGQLSFESTPGKGTTFHIRLPRQINQSL